MNIGNYKRQFNNICLIEAETDFYLPGIDFPRSLFSPRQIHSSHDFGGEV